jgi:hypothetical protein
MAHGLARLALLKKLPKLRELHKKLVQGKVISEEDFWVGKETMVSEQVALDGQKLGLPASSVLDPTAEATDEAVKQQQVNLLTPDAIRRIFTESPKVFAAYVRVFVCMCVCVCCVGVVYV